MRSFLIGLYAGLLLSALRAPLGLELLQLPATTPGAALAYRGAPLLVIAVGLILGLKRGLSAISPTTLLVGAASGFQLHWQLINTPAPFLVQGVFSVLLVVLLIAGHRGGPDMRPKKVRIVLLACAALAGWYLLHMGFPQGHADAVLCGLAGLIALAIVGRCTEPSKVLAMQSSEAGANSAERAPLGGLSAIAICGAGLAILVEGLVRHLRLLGGGLAVDDSVFGSAFLVLAAFGAISFARLFRSRSSETLGRGAVIALSGLAAWGTFNVLENFSGARGLDTFLRKVARDAYETFGFELSLDTSMNGMLAYDLALALPVLVLPAFFCGTAIGLFRRPVELAALLMGAAAGLVLSPGLMTFEFAASQVGAAPELVSSSNSVALALFGGTVAAAGALLTFLTSTALDKKQRLVGCVVAFAGIALCRFPERAAIQILSPWAKRETQALFVLDAPSGLITIETDAIGMPFVTLDRRRITPPSEDVASDRERIRLSWKLLGERAAGQETKVLFIGQLTPDRALLLSDLGATRIDRSASWHRAMDQLERLLFEGAPNWVPGQTLTLQQARQALNAGAYDLVLVAPIEGDAPSTRNLASPEATAVAVWLDGASDMESQHLGKAAAVQAPNLMQLFVGVLRGRGLEHLSLNEGRGVPALVEMGEPKRGVTALEVLGTRRERRGDFFRARLARRWADAEQVPGIATALALHFEAQTVSSPFETREQRVELSLDTLRLISEAASSSSLDDLEISLTESVAMLLQAQRRIGEIEEFLIRPAERHSPWPALEIALARAALELLEPEEALVHLANAKAAVEAHPATLAMRAEAEQQSGDEASAARSLELAFQMAPDNHELERRLAIALVRAGDPRGVAAVLEVLKEDPDDQELFSYTGLGPYPAPNAGFHPLGGHGH